MKQVVFAIALLAMASLTGCLNTDDTSVDENTDTTSDRILPELAASSIKPGYLSLTASSLFAFP